MSEENKITKKIYSCIGLLKSMIYSGERHSRQSLQAISEAMDAVEELETENAELREENEKLRGVIAGNGKLF